jgi:hypothetical protein
MSPLAANTPVGAFTNLTVAAINAALLQAGLAPTTGNVYYCDPVNGLDTNNGQVPSALPLTGGVGPVQSLQAGYNLLRSGFNDVLVLIGNGQASGSARLAAGFTWSKNAAHLIGVCAPSAVSQRARIAPFTAATQAAFANFFTVSGNGCLFSNLSWFQGFTVGIAASICMTITGSRNAFLNCDFEGMGDAVSAADAGSRSILISGGGQENFFGHCNVGLDTVARTGANASVEIAGGGPRNSFENCTFLFDSTDGLQYALLGATAAAFDRWVLFKGCMFLNAINSGSTAIAQLFHLVATVGGIAVLDPTSGWAGVTAIGDATTKAQTYAAGGTATNGTKGIVQT